MLMRSRVPATGANRFEIDVRAGAILADDLEPRVRDAVGDQIERVDQPIDASPLKHRADEQHHRSASVRTAVRAIV